MLIKIYSKPVLISVIFTLLINTSVFYFLMPIIGSISAVIVSGLILTAIITINIHFQVVAPLQACTEHILTKAQGKENRQLTAHGYDHQALQKHRDIGDCYSLVSNTLNDFYHLAGQFVDNGSRIAIVAAEVSFAAECLSKKVHAQVDDIKNIATSSSIISNIVSEAAGNADNATRYATQMRSCSQQGQKVIHKAVQQMRETNKQAQKTSDIVANLEDKSEQIKGITSVISSIAEQTNLLALNAAIEAARAGEQGRGFAVVADEVRILAQKTGEATKEIGSTMDEIAKDVQNAVDTMSVLVEGIASGTEVTEEIGKQLGSIYHQSEQIYEQVENIAAGTDKSASEVNQISTAINSASGHLSTTESDIEKIVKQSGGLSLMAEKMHSMLLEFNLESLHGEVKTIAENAVKDIQDIFELAIRDGQMSMTDLFDRDYQPIADTNPIKYSTRFDQFTDRVLPAIQEPILSQNKNIIYAGAVDNNGYFPTHNLRFSQPLSGDYQWDMANNRTKRIFNDATGSRCGSNTAPFLLQTYKRDTGEVMHDLSVPIFVQGKHWGGFRVGYQASALS